jgi:hypothetical protein
MRREWYEKEKFLVLEKEFAAGLPEGTIDSDEYHELIWEVYRSGVRDGKGAIESVSV